jgi:AmmeMemoRadiSam system protein B
MAFWLYSINSYRKNTEKITFFNLQMSIKNYSREQLIECIRKHHVNPDQGIRLVFANEKYDDNNIEQACALYAPLMGTRYETVVIVERLGFTHDRLLPMISHSSFNTPIGEVAVNDTLRNEFCDEEDDFYIDDIGYSEDISIYDQLMMLQCVLDNFNVLSIQIADERPSIVHELAYTISELLLERNVLVILCSDISECTTIEINKIIKLIRDDEMSTLLNFCNSGESRMTGTGPFLAGIITAKTWELEFKVPDFGKTANSRLFMGGYANLVSYDRK